jgi:hypothetical protein
LLRVLETVAGAIALGLGLWMWLHIILFDVSHGAKIIDRASLIVFMMLVAPPVVLMTGTFLQTIWGKRWGVILVLLGGVAALPFIALNAYFAFGYTGDAWGLRAVYSDLLVLVITMIVSMVNLTLDERASQAVAQSL